MICIIVLKAQNYILALTFCSYRSQFFFYFLSVFSSFGELPKNTFFANIFFQYKGKPFSDTYIET